MVFPVLNAEEAATLIPHGRNIGFSGFTAAGSPREVPRALAARARSEHAAGRPFQIGVIVGASVGEALDGELADADAIAFRMPYQGSPRLRQKINAEKVRFYDLHLSHLSQAIVCGVLPPIDVAVVEATEVTDDGRIFLTNSVGATPIILSHAKKIIVERNAFHDPRLRECHDIFLPAAPPFRREIPIYAPGDRIGANFVQVNPRDIIGIVDTNRADETKPFAPVDKTAEAIAGHLVEFLTAELKAGRLPKPFPPLQSGVGNVANAALSALGACRQIPNFDMYTEVAQNGVFELLNQDRIGVVSSCSLTMTPDKLRLLYADFNRYAKRIVLRPQEITNNPEVVRRLGLVTMNTALEFDIYGHVNSTHVLGSNLMNGIGGSADFTRNALISVFMAESTAKNGAISTVVPMVTHVDHSEHSVQVVVTEQGLADLRDTTPAERAEKIISRCAHPDFKDDLREYVRRCEPAHERHHLKACFALHRQYRRSGSMRGVNWSKEFED
jgi:acetyl-CoA hydrolase